MQALAEFGQVQALFMFIFMIGNAETAAKINIFEAGKNFGGQGFNEIQKHPGRCKITGRFHKERADMLVDAGKHKIMLLQNPENLIKVIRRNAELCIPARRDHLFAVAGSNAGINANHGPAAPVQAAKNIQLGQGIDACKAAFGHAAAISSAVILLAIYRVFAGS